MEKFRSLPLSIIDFLGVLIPGFLWLILLATTAAMLRAGQVPLTPVHAWQNLTSGLQASGTWLGPIAALLVVIVIGYAVKPKAMHLATLLSAPLLRPDRQYGSYDRAQLEFPFTALHAHHEYYKQLVKFMNDIMGCDVTTLPGPQPFTLIKRLLRLLAPALWEELEHREAEVRLLGGAFLVAVYSSVLSLVEVAREAVFAKQIAPETFFWVGLSVVSSLVVGNGFGHLRLREVEYTYLHTLLTISARKNGVLPSANFGGDLLNASQPATSTAPPQSTETGKLAIAKQPSP